MIITVEYEVRGEHGNCSVEIEEKTTPDSIKVLCLRDYHAKTGNRVHFPGQDMWTWREGDVEMEEVKIVVTDELTSMPQIQGWEFEPEQIAAMFN